MSELAHIRSLISSGETHFLEFKRKVERPEKIVKELIALSNADGGKLLIGISDEGTIPGLSNPEGEWFILENALKKFCKPKLKYSAEILPISSKKSVIVIDVPKSKRKPNYFQEEKNGPKEVYVRVQDECVRASREWGELLSYESRRIFVQYGDEEKWLLGYLSKNQGITVDRYKELLKIPRKKASNALVRLAAAGVLRLIPTKTGADLFQLA